MGLLLIGSSVYNMGRKPSDKDVIGTLSDIQKYIKQYHVLETYPINDGKKIYAKLQDFDKVGTHDCFILEAEIAWPDTSGYMLLETHNLVNLNNIIHHTSLDTLYLLKMSHRFLKNSPFFEKTRNDIIYLENILGIEERLNDKQLSEKYPWYAKRVEETYHYQHPNLNRSKTDFFNNSENLYVYDHDDIHRAVALYHTPAYNMYKKDDKEVLTSKSLFDILDDNYKNAGVYEEAAVLALERSLIPNDFTIEPARAFKIALQKVCTSITSGWFREYAWNNYDVILDISERNSYKFVFDFKQALKQGNIRNFGV
jgi:hypothetical protein